ncbi:MULTISPECIES: sensor histidine kinase [Paraclostridium]|uniref:sensor histidine kinase n=1 Tax=Paraclostridium TaxID=1849822 RepID=UPI001A9BC094|nr:MULTISPECIES: HAMP domain-containing sensor histidine kinase [Paraclostridium]MBZ6004784.1 HAMP domain-containing histidine kinase [Paraclostridium bifermentans]MDU0296532.1 HAMP domain-containing sensor histidine kinase [Paraclostridium sp. MRS3W1]MDV8110588.1 HAMP domain-containing sensor histidine kinase [Bacillus sp. BAU-SS-2023]
MKNNKRYISLNSQILIAFSVIVTLITIIISIFINSSFKNVFSKYVDENNKDEVNHLVFDLQNVYDNDKWDVENIKLLGEDAIRKGIALEVYNKNGDLVWSVFEDEKLLSNQRLNTIKKNMKSINQNWNGKLKEYKFDIYDDKKLVGYERIIHYDSIYYMEDDLEFLNIMNKFMIFISIVAIISVIIISAIISKSISNPIKNVSKIAKVIGSGNYKNRLNYKSNIKEVNELTKSIDMLAEELNKQELLRKQLTTDIAHELRTPVTNIQGHLDAIIDGIWDPTPERLTSIREEVQRLGKLIGSIKNLSTFDSSLSQLNKTKTNLSDFIKNITYTYESKALEKNIKIEYELNEVFAYVDKEKFSQVIVNILVNAIKYTNYGGNILIKVENYDDSIDIVIKDNGIGIPKEELHYIFERFYRVDKSRSKDTGGIGVGLAISKAIVSEHGGNILVYSELGKGSEFIIKLPVM